MDKADKVLWEWNSLTEVRKDKAGRPGEAGSRISRCQCPEKDSYPGTLLSIVFCLFLTLNSQSLIYDYIFQVNPSLLWPQTH